MSVYDNVIWYGHLFWFVCLIQIQIVEGDVQQDLVVAPGSHGMARFPASRPEIWNPTMVNIYIYGYYMVNDGLMITMGRLWKWDIDG